MEILISGTSAFDDAVRTELLNKLQKESKYAYDAIGGVNILTERMLIFPECIYVAKMDGKIAGVMHTFPVTEQVYDRLLRGDFSYVHMEDTRPLSPRTVMYSPLMYICEGFPIEEVEKTLLLTAIGKMKQYEKDGNKVCALVCRKHWLGGGITAGDYGYVLTNGALVSGGIGVAMI